MNQLVNEAAGLMQVTL